MTLAKTSDPIVILGAGLAGLSAAYHLRKKPYVLIEREKEVGGTARSFKVGKYTFDFTGHLLHLHTPYTKKLIRKLLHNRFYTCVRKAFIFSNSVRTPYPFQASTYGLPDNVIDDCVLGVFDCHINGEKKNVSNFLEWSRATFGEGISHHFMQPYNEKLYQTSATQMTSDWCGAFVPTPRLEDVICGALETQEKLFGYNSTFLYPKKGGIQALAQAMGNHLKNISLATSFHKILWREKKVVLKSGVVLNYSQLVNTIPMDQLLKTMRPLPKAIQAAAMKLKSAGVLCLNLGVRRKKISDASWIYFPEKKYIFYRVGFPMNFTPHAVPKGCSSMYVEIPLRDVEGMPKRKILKETLKGLVEANILKKTDKIDVVQFLPISHAYVIYNQDRVRALSSIFKFLQKNKIQSIGRYGAWKYSFMEEAILDGKKAAENILAGKI